MQVEKSAAVPYRLVGNVYSPRDPRLADHEYHHLGANKPRGLLEIPEVDIYVYVLSKRLVEASLAPFKWWFKNDWLYIFETRTIPRESIAYIDIRHRLHLVGC